MRGAVFVGVYFVPPARPTASHAITRSLYIEARNYGLSVFIYVVSGNSTRTKTKRHPKFLNGLYNHKTSRIRDARYISFGLQNNQN